MRIEYRFKVKTPFGWDVYWGRKIDGTLDPNFCYYPGYGDYLTCPSPDYMGTFYGTESETFIEDVDLPSGTHTIQVGVRANNVIAKGMLKVEVLVDGQSLGEQDITNGRDWGVQRYDDIWPVFSFSVGAPAPTRPGYGFLILPLVGVALIAGSGWS